MRLRATLRTLAESARRFKVKSSDIESVCLAALVLRERFITEGDDLEIDHPGERSPKLNTIPSWKPNFRPNLNATSGKTKKNPRRFLTQGDIPEQLVVLGGYATRMYPRPSR